MLRNRCYIYMLLLSLHCLSSCSKQEAEEGWTVLDFSPAIEGAAVSKAGAVDGTYFPPGDYFLGLSLGEYASGTFTEQQKGYKNIKTHLNVTGFDATTNLFVWDYNFNGTGHKSLSVLAGEDVTVYAYHPYVTNLDDPTMLPFVSGQDDWMWAVSSIPGAELKSGETKSVNLDFEHAMTCIEVKIRCKYMGSVRLTKVMLKDSEGRLVREGTIDLQNNGAITPNGYSNSIEISPNSSISISMVSVSLIMPEVLFDNVADFTIEFEFNGYPAETVFTFPDTMRDSNGADVPLAGFEKGKRYIFSLMLDNVMRFEPVGIDDQWVVDDVLIEL